MHYSEDVDVSNSSGRMGTWIGANTIAKNVEGFQNIPIDHHRNNIGDVDEPSEHKEQSMKLPPTTGDISVITAYENKPEENYIDQMEEARAMDSTSSSDQIFGDPTLGHGVMEAKGSTKVIDSEEERSE